MAFSFVQYAVAGAQSYTVTCNKPTGTADGDIIFACVNRRGNVSDPITVPDGWTLLCKRENFDGSNATAWIYYKIALSEGDSYTWVWSADLIRTMVVNATYRDFNAADPIDVYSNELYTTSNSTVRSASITLSAANTPVINFAIISSSTAYTFTPPTNFTERADASAGVRTYVEVSDYVYASAGATGDIDATASGDTAFKHGFAVALNPVAVEASPIRFFRRLNILLRLCLSMFNLIWRCFK